MNLSTSMDSHNHHATCARMLSCAHFFATPWAVARQALLSMEFSRQEDWSGLPFPILGDLPDPGVEATSLACLPHWQADSLPPCQMLFQQQRGGQPHLFFSALPRLTPHNRGCAQFFSWVQGDVSLSVETFSLWVEKGLPSLKALLSCIFNYFLSPCALFKGDEPGQISPIT